MPSGLLDKAVDKIKATGVSQDKAYAYAVSALQKSGSLKKGSLAPTKQGIARNKMTPAQRKAHPP